MALLIAAGDQDELAVIRVKCDAVPEWPSERLPQERFSFWKG
jgi:hypothetical protein